MSYILDALNKAERERGIKQAPAILRLHETQNVRGLRMWIGVGAIGLGIIAAIWFFLPSGSTTSRPANPTMAGIERERDQDPADSRRDAGSISASTAAPSKVQPGNSGPAKTESPSDAPASSASKTPAATPPTESGLAKSAGDARPPGPAGQTENAPQAGRQGPGAISPQPPPEFSDAPAAKETLPPPRTMQVKSKSLREAMDGMRITILAFSESKAERRVFINGRKYLEGDYIDDRYLVESITLDGVVLSCESERALLRPGPK